MRVRHRTSTPRTLMIAWAAAAASLFLVRPAARADDLPSSNPEVRVTTNMGSFVIELRPNRAPLTVANFLRYVREGFYNNTLFHRVVANFVIQGGGHDATPPYALKPTYPPVVNESGNGLQNKRGAVGLARATGPHTGNAQFYINLVDNPELDPLPTRWGYAVFGQVVQGMDVVDRIGVVPTGAMGPFKADAPLKPVIIQSITLISPPSTAPASAQPTAQPTPQPGGAPSASPNSASPNSSPPPVSPPVSPPGAPPPAASPQAQPGQPPKGQTPPPDQNPAPPPATPPGPTPSKVQPGEADQPGGN